MRILILQTEALWSGHITGQVFLSLPPDLNLDIEESAWFASGGGTLRDFANYLIAHGAAELPNVEHWTIRYMS